MGKINVEAEDSNLLNEILTSIVGHYNDKQDNFKMNTEGFKVDSEWLRVANGTKPDKDWRFAYEKLSLTLYQLDKVYARTLNTSKQKVGEQNCDIIQEQQKIIKKQTKKKH